MAKKLVIVGYKLLAEVAHSYFEEFSDYQVVAFACHQEFKKEDEIYGLPLSSIESLPKLYPPEEVEVFVAIGYTKMNKIRQRVYEELKSLNYKFATFVHPDVKIWQSNKIGENVLILENNTIQPFTEIGNNTILWSGNHVGHHSKIGHNCFISSHVVISGCCIIGDNVFMGVNAAIHDSIKIADECLIGAGALISKSTSEKGVYPPSSTKVFKKNSEQIKF